METIINEEARKVFEEFTVYYEFAPLLFEKVNKKSFLGSKKRYCRFCNKSSPDVSFGTKAHVFPEFFENKYLLSYHECDTCNGLFGNAFENDMAIFMKPLHAFYGVKGRNKRPPKYINNDLRIEHTGKELKLTIFNDDLLTNLMDKELSHLILKTQPFIPIAIYKCLTKMALAAMPSTEIQYFSKTFKWLQEKNHINSEFELDNLWVIYSQTSNEHRFPFISSILFKKKSEAPSTYPSFIFKLAYAHFSFQIYLPLCDLDLGRKFSVQDLKYFPHLIDITTDFDPSKLIYYNFSSKDKSELSFNLEI